MRMELECDIVVGGGVQCSRAMGELHLTLNNIMKYTPLSNKVPQPFKICFAIEVISRQKSKYI